MERQQRRHLTPAEANQALELLKSGMKQNDVAIKVGVSQSVISRLYRRYIKTGSSEKMKKTGRPKLIDSIHDANLTAPSTLNSDIITITESSTESESFNAQTKKKYKTKGITKSEPQYYLNHDWGEDWHSLMLYKFAVDSEGC